MHFCHDNFQSKKHEKCRAKRVFLILIPFAHQHVSVYSSSRTFNLFLTYSGEMMLTLNIINTQGRYDTCVSRSMTCVSQFWLQYSILLAHEAPCF